jgi:hypothetical protein
MTRIPSTHPKSLHRNTSLPSVLCHSRTHKCTLGTCRNQPSSSSKLLHTKITSLLNKEVAAGTQCHLKPASPNNTHIKHRLSFASADPSIRKGVDLVVNITDTRHIIQRVEPFVSCGSRTLQRLLVNSVFGVFLRVSFN